MMSDLVGLHMVLTPLEHVARLQATERSSEGYTCWNIGKCQSS